ncbi:MAG: fibronectin type III-like domain-contianing protein [Solirubrobacteraceae bacterium]
MRPSAKHLRHRLRHFLFPWLKTQGIDDALIQPYSGHATRQSLEIYSRIAPADAQHAYNERSPTTPSKPRTRLRLVTRFLPAPLYVHRAVDSGRILTPSQQLVGFTRVQLTAGQQKTVLVSFPTSELALTPGDIDGTAPPRVQPGNYQVDFGPTGPSAGFTIH